MARVGRLAGALLAQSGPDYFLVGDIKEPCDFRAAGFEPPGEIDALKRPYLRLAALRPVELTRPCLMVEAEGETLARLLAQRMLIGRNGSVSERLWRLILDPTGEDEIPGNVEVSARWLTEIPGPIWAIVQDTVLRCL